MLTHCSSSIPPSTTCSGCHGSSFNNYRQRPERSGGKYVSDFRHPQTKKSPLNTGELLIQAMSGHRNRKLPRSRPTSGEFQQVARASVEKYETGD
jgi:hypothetical protein